MRRIFPILAGMVLVHGLLPTQATAAPKVTASLVSETLSILPGQTLVVAVRLEHAEHWHTYWKNPGDSGLATSITWKLPPGFSAGPILWPTPQRLESGPLTSYGYTGDMALLTEITVSPGLRPGGNITIEADVSWLECADICVPGQAKLKMELPVQITPPVVNPLLANLFTTMRARVPQAAPENTVRVFSAGTEWIVDFAPPFATPTQAQFYSLGDLDTQFAPAQLLTKTENGRWRLSVKKGAKPGDRLAGVLAMESPAQSAYWNVDLPAAPAPLSEIRTSEPQPGFSAALLLAFAGGIILNLMPCVLPVLSLKVLGFVEQAGQSRVKSLQHGLAFTSGVLLSFWGLAGLLLALRAAGKQFLWGFQLQEPWFVVLLGGFLFLFGLNLLGVFEIGTSLIGLANVSGKKDGLGGSFLSGVLATVVATPCTAPFMGSALGLAISLPTASALAIFTALALGMAAPYLLLSANPGWLRFVPKPGSWMVSLKQFFAFPLFATVIWLIWVYGRQTSLDDAGRLLFGLLLLGLAAWVYGRWGGFTASFRAKTAAVIISTGLLAAGLWLPLAAATGEKELPWESYSETRLAELRSQGKPVFVDFTAAWCLSCQANELVALRPKEVQEAFARKSVVLMKADWTKREPEITRALESFGRNGVPFYVFYKPGADQPVTLPEVLTPAIVLRALAQLPD